MISALECFKMVSVIMTEKLYNCVCVYFQALPAVLQKKLNDVVILYIRFNMGGTLWANNIMLDFAHCLRCFR
jgi:hypothetical protein